MIFASFISVCMSALPLTSAQWVLRRRVLSVNGNTEGNYLRLFIGRELNPRIRLLGYQVVLQLRPGMLLWLAIDLACIIISTQMQISLHSTIACHSFAKTFYVFDGVLNERSCLSMIDISFYRWLWFPLVLVTWHWVLGLIHKRVLVKNLRH